MAVDYFSHDERTVICDLNPVDERCYVGVIINGNKVTHGLIDPKDFKRTAEAYLAYELGFYDDDEECAKAAFILTPPQGKKLVAWPVGVDGHLTMNNVISGNKTKGEYLHDLELPQSVIRQMKEHEIRIKQGIRAEDIREIRPDAGPAGPTAGKDR